MPRLAGQHAAYLERQLNRFVEGDRLPGQTPQHPIADHLEDAEIRAVSRYISRIE
jgi:cytochrome c553